MWLRSLPAVELRKFVHGLYRYVALVRYARERRMMGHT